MLAGLVCYYFFVFSIFERREDRPAPGEIFPDFSLPEATGGTFHLASAKRRHLLILYRGDW